jgi:endonuclease I
MRRHCLIFLLLLSCAYSQVQIIVGEGLSGQDLANYVVTHYKPSATLGYTNARDTMYAVIDLRQGNQLTGVYSGYTITLDIALDPSTDAYNKGMNAEHTWPQSMGADVEPQKSDLHHLFPSKANVNSSRSNVPFGEIPDANTDKWYRLDEVLESIPTANIDEYAEKENNDPDKFEPREIHKGDAARAVFYFYSMYQDAADQAFWDVQKDICLQWNYYDPVDEREYNRTNAIANYQDLPNPFVLDSTLARRIWSDPPVGTSGDISSPQQFYLYSNYPNPFNVLTTVRFELSVATNVRIGIFNILGVEVARLADSHYTNGGHRVLWDGKTRDGCEASTGIYIVRLATMESSQSIRMLMLK